jgi:hypothetical protein
LKVESSRFMVQGLRRLCFIKICANPKNLRAKKICQNPLNLRGEKIFVPPLSLFRFEKYKS